MGQVNQDLSLQTQAIAEECQTMVNFKHDVKKYMIKTLQNSSVSFREAQ